MPDPRSESHSARVNDRVQRLIDIYRDDPKYLRGRIDRLFAELDQVDGEPRYTIARILPLELAFDIALTEGDHNFLRARGIDPCAQVTRRNEVQP